MIEPKEYEVIWHETRGEPIYDIAWVKTPEGREITAEDLVPITNALRKALAEVLNSHGALGGASHELMDHGFTAERAREICELVDEYYRNVRQH